MLEWTTPVLVPPQAFFEIGPAHFVERHGLVVLIAIGESVFAIGVGAKGHRVDVGLVGIAFGLERAVDDPYRAATTAVAIGLGAGAATFLAGDVLFRWTLGIFDNRWRLAAAALAVASIPLATGVAPAAQVGALVIAVGGAQTMEHRVRRPPRRTS